MINDYSLLVTKVGKLKHRGECEGAEEFAHILQSHSGCLHCWDLDLQQAVHADIVGVNQLKLGAEACRMHTWDWTVETLSEVGSPGKKKRKRERSGREIS